MLQLLINGQFVDATGGGTFETYDPRTGEVLMSVAEATAQDVDKAVQAAREVMMTSHNLLPWPKISWCSLSCLCHSSPAPCCGTLHVASHTHLRAAALHPACGTSFLLRKGAPQPKLRPQHMR